MNTQTNGTSKFRNTLNIIVMITALLIFGWYFITSYFSVQTTLIEHGKELENLKQYKRSVRIIEHNLERFFLIQGMEWKIPVNIDRD